MDLRALPSVGVMPHCRSFLLCISNGSYIDARFSICIQKEIIPFTLIDGIIHTLNGLDSWTTTVYVYALMKFNICLPTLPYSWILREIHCCMYYTFNYSNPDELHCWL
jgi:hypothetical protein